MNYVISFAKIVGSLSDRVLLIKKDRPAWQAGYYNLPGGKIEENENHLDAAVRELKEETGLRPCGKPKLMGAINGDWGTVYCVRVPVFDTTINQLPEETEEAFWVNWHEVQDSPLLLPNLRTIIPLMICGTTDWVVKDERMSLGNQTHTIEIIVNSGG